MSKVNVIVCDIGSSKIVLLAGKHDKLGSLTVDASNLRPSVGYNCGIVTDPEQLTYNLLDAIYAAEQICDKAINKLSVSVSGNYVKSYYVKTTINFSNTPITKQDLGKMIQHLLSDFDVPHCEILHYFPIKFILDGEHIVDNPIGIYANSLTCHLHILAVNSLLLKNIDSCFAKCNIEIDQFISASYASCLACLSEDEKKMGVTIIDFGKSTTSISMFLNDNLLYTNYINIGSGQITEDISKKLSIKLNYAEQIKIIYGQAVPEYLHKDININLGDFVDDEINEGIIITTEQLAQIINKRVVEIIEQLKTLYDNTKIDNLLSKRLVLTGGGANLPGIEYLTAKIFDKQTRIVDFDPSNINGIEIKDYNINLNDKSSYMYSTAFGMLRYNMLKYIKHLDNYNETSILHKMLKWFRL